MFGTVICSSILGSISSSRRLPRDRLLPSSQVFHWLHALSLASPLAVPIHLDDGFRDAMQIVAVVIVFCYYYEAIARDGPLQG